MNRPVTRGDFFGAFFLMQSQFSMLQHDNVSMVFDVAAAIVIWFVVPLFTLILRKNKS